MLIYNIKSAIRTLLRFKSHTLISLVGLVIGLACVFVIAAWTIQESQYDRFHKQYETIYMLTTEVKSNNLSVSRFPETPPPLANTLKERIPGIENGFHFIYLYGGREIKTEAHTLKEAGIASDSKLLEVLNFPLLEGDINSIEEPNSIFVTESFAKRLFPDDDAMGKSIIYKKDRTLRIEGILEDIPINSSLQFHYIIPYAIESDKLNSWRQLSGASFIKLRKDADFDKVKLLAQGIFRENITENNYNLNLLPIKKLRYGADFQFFNAEHGSKQRLLLFICVAILILVLACLNYINLISSYALKRTHSVSMRKVNGASRRNLIGHFITESIFQSILAWILSVILAKTLIQLFQSLLNVEILNHFLNVSFLIGFFISFLFVGIISGYYPAFLTSSITPFKTNLVKVNSQGFQSRMKNAFVLSQFILSISLTIASILLIRQTNYLSNYDVGYKSNNVVLVYLPPDGMAKSQALKNDLLSESLVEYVSFASASPVNSHSTFPTDSWTWEGLKEGTPTSIHSILSDEDYLNVFQIPLLDGSFFSASESDTNKVLINEEFATFLGFDDPIGKTLRQSENEYEIIGIVKNYHFQHLSSSISPLLFMYNPSKHRMFVKISNREQGLDAIKKHYDTFYDPPFSYYFVDDNLKQLYLNERKITRAIFVFTLITILLSCVGLIGLIILNTESKQKEIGVRKVLGSKISEIVFMLYKGILKWFGIGFILSSIISWFVLRKWLESFAFRVNLDWWIFILGAFIILLITSMTISWQAWKAAKKNPIEALRNN